MSLRTAMLAGVLALMGTMAIGIAQPNTAQAAKTVNYGSMSTKDKGKITTCLKMRKGIDRRFKHVSMDTFDTQVTNKTNKNVRYYFSQIYLYIKSPKRQDNLKLYKPHRSVVIKAHSKKTVHRAYSIPGQWLVIFAPDGGSQGGLEYGKHARFLENSFNSKNYKKIYSHRYYNF